MEKSATTLSKTPEQIFIPGPTGELECLVLKPSITIRGVALILHPDPMGGGANTNKVIQSVAKAMLAHGYLCYCPNFRGVGQSVGTHDYGKGELDDALAVAKYLQRQYLNLALSIAGFSFGGAMAALLCQQIEYKQLILIAPAITRFKLDVIDAKKTILLHGSDDELISLDEIFSWAYLHKLPVSVLVGASHLFHGKLTQLTNFLNQLLLI